MKVSEILRMLQDDGWFLVATRGSHRQFKHSAKPGRVTVPGKPADDLARWDAKQYSEAVWIEALRKSNPRSARQLSFILKVCAKMALPFRHPPAASITSILRHNPSLNRTREEAPRAG
jgi:predicted RNA binding protein YcfA (HicA-like mRNA interferase family)